MRSDQCGKIVGIFLFVALARCGALCADITVTDKELGYQVTFPGTWTVTAKPHNSSNADGLSSVADGATWPATVRVTAFDVDKGVTQAEAAFNLVVTLWTKFKNFKIIEQSDATMGANKTRKLTFSFDLSDNKNGIGVDYVIIVGDRGFGISCYALKDDYEKYAKEIGEVIKSFKVIEKK